MSQAEIEQLKQELSNNIIRIRNISNYYSYINEIDEKIASLNADKQRLDDDWKANDLRLVDLSNAITNKMYIDEEDKHAKHDEYINLLILFGEKNQAKKKIDEQIQRLEDNKKDTEETLRIGIEALYLFMVDTERDNLEFLNSIGFDKDTKDIEKRFSSTEKPEYYADKIKGIDIYFSRIEYITKEQKKYQDKLDLLNREWQPRQYRLDAAREAVMNRYANYRNGVLTDLGSDIEEKEKECMNLLILQEEYKKAVKVLERKINKLGEINEQMISHVKKAIGTLSNVLNKFEGANDAVFTNDKQTKEPTNESTKVFDDIEFITLPEDKKDKVTVTINLNNGEEPIVVVRDKGEYLDMGQDPSPVEGKEFSGWYENDVLYDFSKPLTHDITINAGYSQKKNHQVNLFDPNGVLIKSIEVENGEKIPGIEDDLVPKKKFKTFEGWELISEEPLINGGIFDSNSQVITDLNLKATYKYNRKRIVAIAAGVATAALATATDVLLSTTVGPTNGLVSNSTALLNGSLAIASAVGIKKAKEPNYQKELEVTGIKKAGAKLLNHFRNKDNLRNWRDYFITSAALSAVSGLVQSVMPEKPVLADPEVNIFDDVPKGDLAPVERFDGIDPNATIYQDTALKMPNGKPNMQFFGDNGAVVRYFDALGKEITKNTPISQIAEGPIKIVETQVDGSNVTMGLVEDFATKIR